MRLKSQNNKDFSVIIPTFNRSQLLRLAIISALKQRRVSFEIIVSDNASTDDTEKVVKEFKDKQIRYTRNKKNLGFALNLKKCLQLSSGDYIFILGDDDFILEENTLFEILKVMKKYKVGVGKIGSIAYDKSPRFPYRASILSEKLIILKPKREKQILLKLFSFGLGFPSGMILENSLINKDKIFNNLGWSFFPPTFDIIKKTGITYIPNYFIVAHLSLRDIPLFWNIKKYGSFFMEDHLRIIREFFTDKELTVYQKEFIHGWIELLPNMKYFSNNRNYFQILRRMVEMDKTLLITPKFLIYALSGFIPKLMIKTLRDFIADQSRQKTLKALKKYNYLQKLKALGIT